MLTSCGDSVAGDSNSGTHDPQSLGFSDDGARMYMGNCGGRVHVWQVWHVWQLKSSAQIYVVSGQV